MKTPPSFITSAFFVLLFSCTGSVLKEMPPAKDASALGITAELILPWSPYVLFQKLPDRIYFARINENGNILQPQEIFVSNFVKGNRAYLLNARPGTYVAFAAYYEVTREIKKLEYQKEVKNEIETKKPAVDEGKKGTGNSRIIEADDDEKENPSEIPPVYVAESKGAFVFFSDEIVRNTQVTVTPGHLFYMGDYSIRMQGDTGKADLIQKTFLKALVSESDQLKNSEEKKIIAGRQDDTSFLGVVRSMDTGKKAAHSFRAAAIYDFKNTEWLQALGITSKRLRDRTENNPAGKNAEKDS
jgi:hypothetical protein